MDSNPLYDIEKTYLENAFEGPFFNDEIPQRSFPPEEEWVSFLGFKVASTIGVPAGPLLNARWTSLAGKLGFDIVTYKTIRSKAHPGHPLPNMIFVDMKEGKAIQRGLPSSLEELSVTNSFGMPSMDPAFLREDIPRAKETLAKGQLLIVSVVGAGDTFETLRDDFVAAALFAKEAGAPVIEVNFSCPNVKGAEGMLYTDPEKVFALGQALSSALGTTPLIAKIGSIRNDSTLSQILHAGAESGIAAISGLNSVSAKVTTPLGLPALGPTRETSGICGSAIREEALHFVKRARQILDRDALPLTLIGVGGIVLPSHFTQFFLAGADSVMSATGMMWDPFLASHYHNKEIYV